MNYAASQSFRASHERVGSRTERLCEAAYGVAVAEFSSL